jgi:hypothetical protein
MNRFHTLIHTTVLLTDVYIMLCYDGYTWERYICDYPGGFCYYGLSTFIWKDILGRPRGVISAMTCASTPKFDSAPRINPHGNHRN